MPDVMELARANYESMEQVLSDTFVLVIGLGVPFFVGIFVLFLLFGFLCFAVDEALIRYQYYKSKRKDSCHT